MVEEKRDYEVGDPIKLFLEESLTQQRKEMMNNFTQILRRLSTMTPSTNSHFGGVTPFKVQVNCDIHLFEGHIGFDAFEKWLSLLEVYFYVQNFSNSEKIAFAFLKSLPHVRYWWET
jgi:hypothetical protein